MCGHSKPNGYMLVADPEGKLRMEAFFCTDLHATPVEILPWVVMRWSVEVTFEGDPSASWSGDATPMVGPSHRPYDPGFVGPGLHCHRAGTAAEPRWSHPSAGSGLVSQSRAALRGLSSLGLYASLARPLCSELYCRGRVEAIASRGS